MPLQPQHDRSRPAFPAKRDFFSRWRIRQRTTNSEANAVQHLPERVGKLGRLPGHDHIALAGIRS